MKKLENMSMDELMDAWTAEGEKWQASKDRLKEFSAEHERRVLQEQAEAKIASLSDAEKAALAQVVQAQGIKSQESVHNG